MILVFEDTVKAFFDKTENDIYQAGKSKGQIKNATKEAMFSQEFAKGDYLSIAQLRAWRWIYEALETGRGVRKSTTKTDFQEKLEKWIESRGIKPKNGQTTAQLARFFRWRINKFGNKESNKFITRPTGTVSDFINEQNIKQLIKDLGSTAKVQILNELKRINGN